ncbi:unnamed protein product [Cyclocybe aegerita]|uniref:Uncharacterized protein n=1 Tax=Cyclocybe aegerita TaxID=1973307 RepID=A0A8S0WMK4_CYCAE|nr:unnamed protein product [Cyclocybe aegerita]
MTPGARLFHPRITAFYLLLFDDLDDLIMNYTNNNGTFIPNVTTVGFHWIGQRYYGTFLHVRETTGGPRLVVRFVDRTTFAVDDGVGVPVTGYPISATAPPEGNN